MSTILYLTQDGITDHIGQAQIAPYLIGLARLGHSIHIVSGEKPGREALVADFVRAFAAVGVRWTRVRYANRPPLVSSFWTLRRLERAAIDVARRERPQIVHCRSYLPLGIASRLKGRFGLQYLADFRDFWADVGIETKRFKPVYRWLRKREPAMLANADRVVTLTDRAAGVLLGRYPRLVGGDRAKLTVIPCCADFALFDRRAVTAQTIAERRRALRLNDEQTLLVYLGSLGPDYLLAEMMRLFAELRTIRPDARFLLLTNNGRPLAEEAARQAGIPLEALRFATATREQIPEYLALADLSVVFIRPTESKSGCSPTKLGELFAMGIPIVANTGFGDIDSIVAPARNRSALVPDFSRESLQTALQIVLDGKVSPARIRETSREFSLDEGIRRYDRVYRSMTGDPDVAKPVLEHAA